MLLFVKVVLSTSGPASSGKNNETVHKTNKASHMCKREENHKECICWT